MFLARDWVGIISDCSQSASDVVGVVLAWLDPAERSRLPVAAKILVTFS